MSSQGKGACTNRIGVIVLFVLIDIFPVRLRCMSVTQRTVTRNEPSLTEIDWPEVSVTAQTHRLDRTIDLIITRTGSKSMVVKNVSADGVICLRSQSYSL